MGTIVSRNQNLFLFRTWAEARCATDPGAGSGMDATDVSVWTRSRHLTKLYLAGLLDKNLEKQFNLWLKDKKNGKRRID